MKHIFQLDELQTLENKGELAAMRETKNAHAKSGTFLGRCRQRVGSFDFVVIGLACAIYGGLLSNVAGMHVMRKMLWKTAATRPPTVFLFMIGGWGFVLRICASAGINLKRLDLKLEPQDSPFSWRWLRLFCGLYLWIHLIHLLEFRGQHWRPSLVTAFLIHGSFLLLLVHISRSTKTNVFGLLRDTVTAPFSPVTFKHVLFADCLTSVAKALVDMHMTGCVTMQIVGHGFWVDTRTTDLWNRFFPVCSHSVWRPVALMVPSWWRLMQCLHVYGKVAGGRAGGRVGRSVCRWVGRQAGRQEGRTPP
jgi:hypothetical protein